MKILVVFGRTISPEAMKNMELINKTMKNNQEFTPVSKSTKYVFIYSQTEYMRAFKKKFNLPTDIYIKRPQTEVWVRNLVMRCHPKLGSLRPEVKEELYNIAYYVYNVTAMLITDNSLNKGRPAFAIKVAKTNLIPHLDLGREDLKDKLKLLQEKFEKKAEIQRDAIRKAANRMAKETGIQFKLSEEKLHSMSRNELSSLAKSLTTKLNGSPKCLYIKK